MKLGGGGAISVSSVCTPRIRSVAARASSGVQFARVWSTSCTTLYHLVTRERMRVL